MPEDVNGTRPRPEPGVLRVLDANADRAREALRVIEDYARFVLDDPELSGRLKQLRHDLTDALGAFVQDAILCRDTPGDVGTTNKTPSELTRQNIAHVVTAAGRRLGEALRSLEEFTKVLNPAIASKVESVRYRFYDLEQAVARTLRPANRFADVRLYVLITESVCKRPWLEAAEQAILGGADCLQLREKSLDSGELLARARELVTLCRKHNVICVINDRPDIAILAGADGVHLGQSDLPVTEARKLLGRDKIIGVSTHNLDQAKQAVRDGADYLGVGPVFPSPTKPRDFLPGLDFARQVARANLPVPAVAIAGITGDNVDEVIATGLRAAAVTASVIGCDNVRAASERLKTLLTRGIPAPAMGRTPPQSGGTDIPARSGGTDIPARSGGTDIPAQSGGTDIPVCLSTRRDIPVRSGGTDIPAQSGGTDIPVCLSTRRDIPVLPSSPKPLQIKERKLPHWTVEGSTYFITFRVLNGELQPHERKLVLNHILSGDGPFYRLDAAVVMPDHTHLLLEPAPGYDLARILKGTKGVSARLVNGQRHVRGQLWQDESFDRIMRDHAEYEEKLLYIINNPAKRGLVNDPWDYDALYVRTGD
ncbi:MAG: thiamine phosphate synthase [Tepidisphaeraceae bacterium]